MQLFQHLHVAKAGAINEMAQAFSTRLADFLGFTPAPIGCFRII
jgi:hypothetical protein